MSTDQPAHAPLELRSWAAAAFGPEHALSPIQLAIGGAVLDSVWSQGIAEGRRQATEQAAQILDPEVVQAYGTDIQTLVGAAVRISHREGWREATEGWDREWGYGRDGDVRLCKDEDDARGYADLPGWAPAVSRLVGPWEPVEQPEPVTEAQYAQQFRRIGESEAQILADELAAEQPEGSDRLCGEPIEGEPEPCALRAGHRSSEHLSANVIGWQRALGGPLPADDLPPEGSDHHA